MSKKLTPRQLTDRINGAVFSYTKVGSKHHVQFTENGKIYVYSCPLINLADKLKVVTDEEWNTYHNLHNTMTNDLESRVQQAISESWSDHNLLEFYVKEIGGLKTSAWLTFNKQK